MACNANLMPNLILNPYRLVRSLPDRGILKRVICCTIVVAFALTTILPPSFAQELQLTTKLSPTSRFETTGVASNGPSPASLTPGWMRVAAAAVIALVLVSCTGNTQAPQQNESSQQVSAVNPKEIEALIEKALNEPMPNMRSKNPLQDPAFLEAYSQYIDAKEKLAKIGRQAVRLLLQAFEANANDRSVRTKIVEILGSIGDPAAIPAIMRHSQDVGLGHDGVCLKALLKIGKPATQAVIELLSSKGALTLDAAMEIIKEDKSPSATAILIEIALTPISAAPSIIITHEGTRATGMSKVSLRITAITALGERGIKDEAVISALERLSGKGRHSEDDLESDAIRQAAQEALGKLNGASVGTSLKSLLLPFIFAFGLTAFAPSYVYAGVGGDIVNAAKEHYVITAASIFTLLIILVAIFGGDEEKEQRELLTITSKIDHVPTRNLLEAAKWEQISKARTDLSKLGKIDIDKTISILLDILTSRSTLQELQERAARELGKLGNYYVIDQLEEIKDRLIKERPKIKEGTPEFAASLRFESLVDSAISDIEKGNNSLQIDGISLERKRLRLLHSQLKNALKNFFKKDPEIKISNLLPAIAAALFFGAVFGSILFGWETGQELVFWPGIHIPYGSTGYYVLRYVFGIVFTFGGIMMVCVYAPFSFLVIARTNSKIGELNNLIGEITLSRFQEAAQETKIQKLTNLIKKLHNARHGFDYSKRPVHINLLFPVLEAQQSKADAPLKSPMIALVGILAARPDAEKSRFQLSSPHIGWHAFYEFYRSGRKEKTEKTQEDMVMLNRSALALLSMMLLDPWISFDKVNPLIPYVTALIQDESELPEIKATAIYLLGKLAEKEDVQYAPFAEAAKVLAEMFNKKDSSIPHMELGYTLYNIVGLRDKIQPEEVVPASTSGTRHEGAATFSSDALVRPLGVPVLVPAGKPAIPVSSEKPSDSLRSSG